MPIQTDCLKPCVARIERNRFYHWQTIGESESKVWISRLVTHMLTFAMAVPAEQPDDQAPEAKEPLGNLNAPRPKRWEGPEDITGKVTWPLPNLTGKSTSETSFEITEDLGFVQQGAGYILMGLGAEEEDTPRPRPPTAELRKAADARHSYPDLRQPPLREEFDGDAAFNEALLHWLINVAPTVVRRNKRLERLELKPGATAKEIADAIREKAKGETG